MKKRISLLLTLVLLIGLTGVAPAGQSSKAATKIKLNKTSLTLDVGKTVKLVLKKAKGKITWKSSRKSVASVDKKGVVKGKKAGSAAIVATNKGKTYFCNVNVVSGTSSNVESTDNPEVSQTSAPELTSAPTATPMATPTATVAPTVAPTSTLVSTATPSPSTPTEHRAALKEYITSKGSIDSTTGYYSIRYSISSGVSTLSEVVYFEYDPKTDRVHLQLVADTKITTYPYGHMSSVSTVKFDMNGNADLSWTDFTYDSYDKMKHTGMLTYKGTNVSQISNESSYPWTITLNSGSGSYDFGDDDLSKLADSNMKLALVTFDSCFLTKIYTLKTSMKNLGFDVE